MLYICCILTCETVSKLSLATSATSDVAARCSGEFVPSFPSSSFSILPTYLPYTFTPSYLPTEHIAANNKAQAKDIFLFLPVVLVTFAIMAMLFPVFLVICEILLALGFFQGLLVVVVVVNFLKAIMGHAIPEFPLFFRICSGSHV